MPNQSEEEMAGNVLTFLPSLSSNTYKRSVPSAKPCKCTVEGCGKVISRPRELLTHIQKVHKLRHLFWCEKCDVFYVRPSDLQRHGLYVHGIPEWTTALSTKVYALSVEPPPFNSKSYFQGLGVAERLSAPYPKVPKKRRACVPISPPGKRVKLSEVPTGVFTTPPPVVAIQLSPMSVYTQTCLDTPSQVSKPLTLEGWEEMCNTQAKDILLLRNKVVKLETTVNDLTEDSEQVCTELSKFRDKCVKLEEALRVAKGEVIAANSDAQNIQSELLASKKNVIDCGVAALESEKLIRKEQERLGSCKVEVLTLRKSNEDGKRALEVARNENFMLRKKVTPIVQEIPDQTLTAASSVGQVHMVGMEERMKAADAMVVALAVVYVKSVFDILYLAIERSAALPDVEGKFTAKFLVDECHFVLYNQDRKARVGFIPYRFRFENKI